MEQSDRTTQHQNQQIYDQILETCHGYPIETVLTGLSNALSDLIGSVTTTEAQADELVRMTTCQLREHLASRSDCPEHG